MEEIPKSGPLIVYVRSALGNPAMQLFLPIPHHPKHSDCDLHWTRRSFRGY